jgi:hypothetical protein
MKQLLSVLLVLCFSICRAESIGHAELQIAEPWVALASYVTNLTYDNGALVIPMQNKVFYIPGPGGVPKALLVITGTETRIPGSVRWISEICPDARPKYFSQDYGSNKQTRVRECLIVNSSFALFSYFRPESEVLKAAREKGVNLFKVGYSFRSVYGANGGALVRVNLMTTKAFRGLPTSPETEDLHEVVPELVAWGEALHNSVRKSASSLRGELVLPAIEFSN